MNGCFISGLCFGSVTDNISPSSVTCVPDYAQHMRGATALVTCGAGFIGSKIVDAQFSAGGRALDDLSMGNRRNLVVVTTSPIAELIVGSVSGATAVRHTVAGCNQVFHLAAMVGISQSVHQSTK
jgi:UDP-glucose 4-epimerase